MLFEQAVMLLVREMPVASAARIIETTDKRLWRIVHNYVNKAMAKLSLSALVALGLDETSLRGHEYITVFVDLDRSTRDRLSLSLREKAESASMLSRLI